MAKRVVPAEAAALLEQGWTYIDVRSVPEFEAGHPKGAFNIPLLHMTGGRMAPNPDFQRVVEANYPRDAKLVLGCKVGGRSLQAATLLEGAGFTSLVDVRGGFSGERDPFGRVQSPGWVDSGLPVEVETPPSHGWTELAAAAQAASSPKE